MIRRLLSFWSSRDHARSSSGVVLTTTERFKAAFAPELDRIESQRARHARVKPSKAELQARVHEALMNRRSA